MANLTITRREGFGLAAIMLRGGRNAAQVAAILGCETPNAPRRAIGLSGLSLIGAGPATWFAYVGNASPLWAEDLRDRLAGVASVSDQSSGYEILRLEGEDARRLLQRGVAIDLYTDHFAEGAAATTLIAHMGVIVWRVGPEAYEVAHFRSFTDSFRHWVDHAAAAL